MALLRSGFALDRVFTMATLSRVKAIVNRGRTAGCQEHREAQIRKYCLVIVNYSAQTLCESFIIDVSVGTVSLTDEEKANGD